MFDRVKKFLGIEKEKPLTEERSPKKAQFIKYDPAEKLDKVIEELNADN